MPLSVSDTSAMLEFALRLHRCAVHGECDHARDIHTDLVYLGGEILHGFPEPLIVLVVNRYA